MSNEAHLLQLALKHHWTVSDKTLSEPNALLRVVVRSAEGSVERVADIDDAPGRVEVQHAFTGFVLDLN